MKIIYLLIILLGFAIVFINSQKCTVTIEGYHFDLSPLIKQTGDKDYKYVGENGDIYYFNICNNTVAKNKCGNDAVGYLYQNSSKQCYPLGTNREFYSLHSTSGLDKTIMVSYRNGAKIPNVFDQRYELLYVFSCNGSAGAGTPKVFEVNEYGVVVVHWPSKYACGLNLLGNSKLNGNGIMANDDDADFKLDTSIFENLSKLDLSFKYNKENKQAETQVEIEIEEEEQLKLQIQEQLEQTKEQQDQLQQPKQIDRFGFSVEIEIQNDEFGEQGIPENEINHERGLDIQPNYRETEVRQPQPSKKEVFNNVRDGRVIHNGGNYKNKFN